VDGVIVIVIAASGWLLILLYSVIVIVICDCTREYFEWKFLAGKFKFEYLAGKI